MPNRYIRESAIESEAISSLSWEAEVFLRRLFNRVDDYGRISASTQILRASLFPLQLDRVSEKKVEGLLVDLEKAGLIGIYQVDSKKFLQVAKWEQGRAKASRYPAPPADICKHLQTYVYGCEQMSADVNIGKHMFTNAPDSDSDTDSDTDTDPTQGIAALRARIGSWFKRRPETSWSQKELKALKATFDLNTPESEILLLEIRYRSGNQFLRRDILTLLNNWNTEIDRAKSDSPSGNNGTGAYSANISDWQ
jgi:hypothetical protein